MSENTYMEQYLNQVILPRYLHDWLMKSLKEMKGKKNAGQLKKVHKLIDLVEKSGKKLALYEKVLLELMVTDYKYIWNNRWNRAVMERCRLIKLPVKDGATIHRECVHIKSTCYHENYKCSECHLTELFCDEFYNAIDRCYEEAYASRCLAGMDFAKSEAEQKLKEMESD